MGNAQIRSWSDSILARGITWGLAVLAAILFYFQINSTESQVALEMGSGRPVGQFDISGGGGAIHP